MSKDDFNLDDLLKRVRVPERSAGYWQQFPKRVTRRLHEQPAAAHNDTVRRLYWWLAVSAACVVAVLGFVFWKLASPSASSAEKERARSETMYRQIAAVFPDRLQAVVVDGPNVRLALSDKPDVPASAPLFVEICGGNRCRSIITFSGQQVRVNGETFEVLSDAQGNVIVVGRHFAWSSAAPNRNPGSYRIRAQTLEVRS